MSRLSFSKYFLLSCFFSVSCNGQTTDFSKNGRSKIVGGGCDGCELMYIGMPKEIPSSNTSLAWNETGQKVMITGTVYQIDGKTPAPDVIIYYWQTDNEGYYSPKLGMIEQAKKHGLIRGWVKTDLNGKYTIKTIRPAPYPKQLMPAHIHLSIKEPDVYDEYYTDEITFDDDKFLIPYFKKYPKENRGGNAVVKVLLKDNLQIVEHNIVLGLNIPNYPKESTVNNISGLNIGEAQPSFTPFHAYGPDKGTRTCPVCKYGRYHGIIYFVGHNPNWQDINKWLTFLEIESEKRKSYLKVYFVYGNEKNYNQEARQSKLENLGSELHLQHTALTFVPSFTDHKSEAHRNKINPDRENTFIIYKHGNIVDKYIDLLASEDNFNTISASLDRTQGIYFDLPEPKHK